MTLIELAKRYCIDAHESIGQVRKGSLRPYYFHPFEVADLISKNAMLPTVELIVAALLHDVIEDVPGTSLAVLENKFGTKVSRIVDVVSHDKTVKHLPRKDRVSHELKRIADVDLDIAYEVHTLKVADAICNLREMSGFSDSFKALYSKEKKMLYYATEFADALLRDMLIAELDKLGVAV